MITRAYMREYRNKPFWIFRIIGWVILGIIGAAALAFVLGYVVMLLWNWIMPEIFGLATITFWHAFGIVLLARIIFGSFKHHHDKRPYSPSRRFSRPPFRETKSEHHKKWRHFDKFWEDEGEKAFDEYVNNEKDKGSEKE